MWKAAAVAAGVFALAGTTVLVAQDRGPDPRPMGPHMAQGGPDGPRWGGGPGWHRWGRGDGERRQLSADDMRAFADARIAALHAGLELRPDQEKNWGPFEQALRAAAKDRIERRQAREAAGDDQPRASDPVERLKRVADALSRRGATLKQIADTAAPLYASLDDGQKNRFRMLARMGRHHHHMGWRGRGERGGEEGNR